jgi:hypothetical protein
MKKNNSTVSVKRALLVKEVSSPNLHFLRYLNDHESPWAPAYSQSPFEGIMFLTADALIDGKRKREIFILDLTNETLKKKGSIYVSKSLSRKEIPQQMSGFGKTKFKEAVEETGFPKMQTAADIAKAMSHCKVAINFYADKAKKALPRYKAIYEAAVKERTAELQKMETSFVLRREYPHTQSGVAVVASRREDNRIK